MSGRRRLLVPLVAVLLAGIAGYVAHGFALQVTTSGPAEGARIGTAAIGDLAIVATANDAGRLSHARLTLDGRDVRGQATVEHGRLVYRPTGLSDGSHTISLTVSHAMLPRPVRRSWRFTVDRTPPSIDLDAGSASVPVDAPVHLKGKLAEPASLTADGRQVSLHGGRFQLDYARPPDHPILLAATDRAGNERRERVRVTLRPRLPAHAVRAVHVSADGWAYKGLREPVLAMLRQGRINAVELDLKDEGGEIGYDSTNALGRRIGSVKSIYRLEPTVAQLHRLGARVIGRIVAFRDPILAAAAWKAGHRDEVIQTPSGQPYSGYGGFTNFANPVVRQYNVDIAREAARAGVDDILYDYIRRPDGPRSTMVFPKLHGSAEASLVAFLAETRAALAPTKTFLGASVFGISATRPAEVAQNIPAMARKLDYVAPMVYPSHWAAGEYGVANPNSEPGMIVQRSLRTFAQEARGTGARVVPWLQDFSLGVTYGEPEVRAQIDAARKDGIGEFMLWDPGVTYTASALSPRR